MWKNLVISPSPHGLNFFENPANALILTKKKSTGNNYSDTSISNSHGLDQVASKFCELITENEAFQQIKTDAISLAFQENLNKLKAEVKNLKEEN